MDEDAHAYWQRLRKDTPSSVAAVMAVLCAAPAFLGLVILIATETDLVSPENPFLILPLLPFCWWARSLAWFEPRTARTLRPAFVIGPVLSALNAVSAMLAERSLAFFVAAMAWSAACAIVGELTYRRSLLLHEGPDRRFRRRRR